MKKNLTIQFFKNNYELIASAEDDYLNYQLKRSEAQNETKSTNWKLVYDPEENNSDFAVWDNGDHRIISNCGVSSLYKKINDNGTNRNLKIEA